MTDEQINIAIAEIRERDFVLLDSYRRKLADAREQRDRLAEALERCLNNSWDGPMPDYARQSANEALAAVKGGSDES